MGGLHRAAEYVSLFIVGVGITMAIALMLWMFKSDE